MDRIDVNLRKCFHTNYSLKACTQDRHKSSEIRPGDVQKNRRHCIFLGILHLEVV
jgi:hypothetical protein